MISPLTLPNPWLMPSPPPVHAGDDLYTRAHGGLTPYTAWCTRGRRESPTLATHQAKVRNSDTIVHALMKEGVVEQPWEQVYTDLIKRPAEWCILRRVTAPTVVNGLKSAGSG